MKGFVQQLLLYALIEGKHAGRYDLNRIRSPAVAIDLVGEAVLRQNLGGIDLGWLKNRMKSYTALEKS